MFIHVLIALFTAFMIYVAQPGSSFFSWHPALMTIAVALFMFEGLLQFSNQNSFLRSANRSVKVKAHWIIQISALVCLLVGGTIVFWHKHSLNKPHYTTWHGVFGLMTIILTLIQCCGGFMVNNYRLLPPTVNLGTLKYGHAISGMVTSVLASVALLFGLYSNWFASQVILPIQVAVAVFPIAMGFTIVIQITQRYFPALWKSG